MIRAAGRRPPGGLAPARGACPAGMHPPFSFPSCGKENGPCTVQKKRPLRRAPARSRLRATGVGGSVQAPILACLRARYHLLRFLGLPSRGGWCGGRRGARTHLICSSFRAFRFATRCPGGRRSGSLAYAAMLLLSSTTGQRQRKEELDVSQTSPGQRFPQGSGVSVPDFYKGVPAIPRRRQEVCAGADRPADAFFLFHRARRILFLALPKREWGAHPRGNSPLAGASPPRPAARISPGGH